MKSYLLLLLVLVAQKSMLFGQLSSHNAEVTYIGNEGFMITNNNKKVFIDALYTYPFTGVLNYADSTKNKIKSNLPPFENSQLFVVTHKHSDHYNKGMISEYLVNNLNARFCATDVIVSEVTTSALKPRIIGFGTGKLQSKDTIIEDIEVTALTLTHDINYRTVNLGYVIKLDDLTVYHGGDNTMEDTSEINYFKLNNKNIDIAFLNYNTFWKTEEQRSFVKRRINPRFVILMHISPGSEETTYQLATNLGNSFPPVIVFKKSLEKQVVKLCSHDEINTSTNEPVSFKLTEIFNDPTLKDEQPNFRLSIPKELNYDNSTQSINGTIGTEGTFPVELTLKNNQMELVRYDVNIMVKNSTGLDKMSSTKNSSIFVARENGNTIRISNPDKDGVLCRVFDITGKTVLQKNIEGEETLIIDFTPFGKGIFVFNFASKNRIQSNKISVF